LQSLPNELDFQTSLTLDFQNLQILQDSQSQQNGLGFPKQLSVDLQNVTEKGFWIQLSQLGFLNEQILDSLSQQTQLGCLNE
jgi:hypothetical protein